MVAASITTPIGKIFQPLLDFVGAVLAFFYSIVPNYPIDVALLTIVIMAALTPLTVKSTKNMAAMQALGPEMKKLQQKYKGADNRTQMNEEMMKLYKEHNVNPASGCLPMLLQMPAFFILYSVIRGMTNTVTVYHTNASGHKVATLVSDPRYIPKNSEMFRNIKAAGGHLNSFGMDFSEKLLSHHGSIWIAIPYLLLVAGAVGLQYLQMSRLNARNPQAAQANPQAAMMQKYMPLIFGFIYLNVAAILNVYFIVSSAIRILTQEILFRKGIVAGPAPAPAPAVGAAGGGTKTGGTKTGGTKTGGTKKGPAADRSERALPKPKTTSATAKTTGSANGTNGKGGQGQGGKTTPGPSTQKKVTGSANGANVRKSTGIRNGSSAGQSNAKRSSNRSNGSGSADADRDSPAPKEHPRSKAKRERKAR
jgi:YidC/Oxa1 family membrane protein insertase